MPRKKKDPQGRRVYKWQWEWFDWNRKTISLADAKKLVNKACDAWDIHPPRSMGMIKGKPYSIYNEDNQSLRMLPEHLNPATVLHEVAHHIMLVRYGTGYPDHGPAWLGVFVDLLVAFKVAPEEAILASLRARGLKFELPKDRTKLV